MVPRPVPQIRIPGGASNLPLPQLTQPYRRVYHPPHSVTAPLQFPLSQPRRVLDIFPTPSLHGSSSSSSPSPPLSSALQIPFPRAESHPALPGLLPLQPLAPLSPWKTKNIP